MLLLPHVLLVILLIHLASDSIIFFILSLSLLILLSFALVFLIILIRDFKSPL
jgi:hypothetical protein